ncbi:MAG: aldolase/citrate lyase family protein [Bacillota bacterium]|nr:aldolase/citrate lyase family protein [Bacillota bacterium]MDW7676412.1 aldolase/citrate lyase family protein [Bacillota bacterium]
MKKMTLKSRLRKGEKLVGMFITSTDPGLTEVAAITGYDFVVIDTEHGPLNPTEAMHHIRAAEAKGISPVCRATNAEATTILRLLDVGAHGIQVPQVNNMETARQVVAAAKYSPAGTRGMALPRALDYGMGDFMPSFQQANDETIVIVHCETKESLDVIEEIAAIDEVDVVFLGPFDLSQSLGIPGQTAHPLIQEAVKKVLGACSKHNKAAGIFAADGDQAKKRLGEGFQYVTINLDMTLFGQKCLEELKKIR